MLESPHSSNNGGSVHGFYSVPKGRRGKKPRSAPFIPPFKVVVQPSVASVLNFKVVDAAGARIFGGCASRLGVTTIENTMKVYNEQVKSGRVQVPVQV